MLKAGKKIPVTLVDAGLNDKDGVVQPYLTFKTEEGDKISWFGSLKSEASQNLAIKNFLTAGFIGNDWGHVTTIPFELAFKKVEGLTVEIEESTYNGKKSLKVKFINASKKKAYNGITPSHAAAFAKFKEEMGVKETLEEAMPF